MAEKPRQIEGLVCYYVHWAPGGAIRNSLYRPAKGPWTPTLRRRCTSAQQGLANVEEQPGRELAEPAPAAKRQSLIRAELKAKQGSLEL